MLHYNTYICHPVIFIHKIMKNFFKRLNVHVEGFSLLEISISLIIIGIISSFCLSQIKIMKQTENINTIKQNINIIINSLGAYYFKATDASLPYPSDFHKNLGYQSENMKMSFGIVPYKNLGIMEGNVKDNRGYYIKYRLNPYFNNNSKIYDREFINLGIKDFHSDYNDKIAFILRITDENDRILFETWMSERNFKMMFKRSDITSEISSLEKHTKSETMRQTNKNLVNHELLE